MNPQETDGLGCHSCAEQLHRGPTAAKCAWEGKWLEERGPWLVAAVTWLPEHVQRQFKHLPWPQSPYDSWERGRHMGIWKRVPPLHWDWPLPLKGADWSQLHSHPVVFLALERSPGVRRQCS